MQIYGIKTCGSVKKALAFFKEHGIENNFIDFKKTPVDCDKVEEWLKNVEMGKLFNTRGTMYRNLKLKELNLDDTGKKEWLCKENLLIKRPVIEYKDQVIVGFDEGLYSETFL